jgi:hypothetical protein
MDITLILQRFYGFVTCVKGIIPMDNPRYGELNDICDQLLLSATYTAPEQMWRRKHTLCAWLSRYIPYDNPPLPWQVELAALVRADTFGMRPHIVHHDERKIL